MKGMDEARDALRQACPQATDAEIEQALRGLKAKNQARGGA